VGVWATSAVLRKRGGEPVAEEEPAAPYAACWKLAAAREAVDRGAWDREELGHFAGRKDVAAGQRALVGLLASLFAAGR
jgi:hypothetical protein